MGKTWSEGKAIYQQIMESICGSIASGELSPGQRVLSVREYAAAFGVNPNTMQRALYELEREGVLLSQRNTGRFVTKDAALIGKMKAAQAEKAFQEFYAQLKLLGYSEEEMARFFRERLGEAEKARTGGQVC